MGKKSLVIVSDGGGDFGPDDLESNGLDNVAASEGSKTIGKGNRCLGCGWLIDQVRDMLAAGEGYVSGRWGIC